MTLTFKRVHISKYKSISINISKAVLILKDEYEIINIKNTLWGYSRSEVQLNHPEFLKKIKDWETQTNDYLESEGFGPITISYGKKIYPKTFLINPEKDKANFIILTGVWIKHRPFLQLWLK